MRSRIEYSLFLCLGLLWKNFDKLDPAIQQGITLVPQVEVEESDTNNLSESFSIGGKQYTIGDVVDVTIAKIVPYGAFATLDASTTGLIHISEIADRFIANINDEFVEGQSCKARIINIDYQTGRISLSSKEFHE